MSARVYDSRDIELVTTDATPTEVLSYDVSANFAAQDLTLLYALISELATDAAAHFEDLTSHVVADEASGDLILADPGDDFRLILARLQSILEASIQHTLDENAHLDVDNTSYAAVGLLPTPTDIPTALTFANALKAAHNTHLANLTVHQAADATNTVTAADAVDTDFWVAVGGGVVGVKAIEESTTDSRVWKYELGFKMDATGAVSFQNLPINTVDLPDAGAAPWTVSISPSGGSIVVEVTGEVGKTITWLGALSVVSQYLSP